ncbi:hypothetical protein GCM10007908_03400 [Rhizobium albus]|nr:hypothetical protein GCM10007908_03400 [Rhizobium albus]
MTGLKAIDYFRAGLDTSQIAALLRCTDRTVTEAQVYNLLHQQREAEREPVRTPRAKRRPINPVWRDEKKIEYAGKERKPKRTAEEQAEIRRKSNALVARRQRERLSALRHAAVLP